MFNDIIFGSVQFSRSVMSDSLQPHGLHHIGFPILYYLSEFAQTHVHWVSDAIQPSQPLPPPSPLALNLSKPSGSFPMHGLCVSGGQRTGESASVLPMNIQGRFPLRLTGLVSLLSKELSRVFSNTTVWKHQFFSTQSSLRSNSCNSNCWHMTGLTLLLTTCSRCPQGQCRCSLTQLLFTQPVMSSSFQPPGLQHAGPPCPSPSPGVCPSSHSLLQWGRSAISSSDILFSFCRQSFPASGTFPMSPLFSSGDQNTGASASVLPVTIQGWSPLRLTGLISLLSKSLSGLLSSTSWWGWMEGNRN